MAENPEATRRRVPRRRFRTSVGCLLKGDYTIVHSKQVGEGGMSIQTKFEPAVGDLMVLSFRVPGGSLVCVRGEVRYREQLPDAKGSFLVGIQFRNLDFHFKRELRNLVAQATQEQLGFTG